MDPVRSRGHGFNRKPYRDMNPVRDTTNKYIRKMVARVSLAGINNKLIRHGCDPVATYL